MMDIKDIGKIFWEKITHANDFVSDIADKLDDKENIILVSLDDIPWYGSFRDFLQEFMDNKIGIGKYEIISPSKKESKEQCLFGDEKSFIDSIRYDDDFFYGRTKYEFQESVETFVSFFAKNAFLQNEKKNIYVWLELYFENSFYNWIDFISDYIKEKEKNNKNIVFIISYHQDNCKANYKIQSNFVRFSLFKDKQYINWYDCYVFFTIVSNLKDIIIDEYFKLYLSELLTNIIRDNITGKNIRLCVECLKDYKNLLNDPVKTIQNIFSEYHLKEDFITGAIYRSQIRVIYPILNEFRLDLIKKYEDKLNNILKKDKEWLVDICKKKKSPKIPERPEDFEFGTLKQCNDDSKIQFNNDKEPLCRYAEARNILSHIGFINYSDHIPKKGSKWWIDLKYIINILKQKGRR